MPHQIQLRGPWEFEWLTTPPDGQPAAGRFTLPQDWRACWGETPGCVACHRWFHRPTNLEDNEQVWVVAEGLQGCRRFLLNGEHLADVDTEQPSIRIEVTTRLRARNQLSLQLVFDPCASGPTGIAGPVRLEIGPKSAEDPAQAASTEDSQTAE